MIAEKLDEARQRQAELELASINQRNRYLESTLELFQKVVSFEDELFDATGRQIWSRIAIQDFGQASSYAAYTTESKLNEVRNQARHLAIHNEFAINGHENRISYIVGEGHEYKVEARAGQEPPDELVDQVRDWFQEWCKQNKWHKRQQEIVRRRDRDGEAFLRYFPGEDGMLRVRFVEPEKIETPDDRRDNPRVRYGIEFDEDDAETPLRYFVSGEPVEAAEVQHRKANVDLASPRGLPTFYPVRKNLMRAEDVLRAVGVNIHARSKIAWIVKHLSNQAAVQNYLSGKADIQTTTSQGDTQNYRQLRDGTVKHIPQSMEYEWPDNLPDVAKAVIYIQAELRAVASRLVMPEFMLTSDASNANYSSTMVAEGPAVKMFERQQADMIADDEEVIERAVKHAVANGRLPENVLDLVEIKAEAPTVRTRDRLKDAQADQTLRHNKVLSKATMAARHGLDYEAEKENMEEEGEDDTGWGVPPRPFGQGEDDESARVAGEDG